MGPKEAGREESMFDFKINDIMAKDKTILEKMRLKRKRKEKELERECVSINA